MLYCNSGSVVMGKAAAPPHRFIYGSRANAAIFTIRMSMDSYTSLGIPKHKIVSSLANVLPLFSVLSVCSLPLSECACVCVCVCLPVSVSVSASASALRIHRPEQVMLLPWFGSDFACADSNCSSVLPNAATGPQGGCGQAVDGGPGYSQAMALLDNRTALGTAVGAKMWDEDSATAYFRWRNSSDLSLHELWFDDARSFGAHSLCFCSPPLLCLRLS